MQADIKCMAVLVGAITFAGIAEAAENSPNMPPLIRTATTQPERENTAEYQFWDTLYVVSTGVNVRTRPSKRADIAATLPIGAEVRFEGTQSPTPPNCRRHGEDEEPSHDTKWICFSTDAIAGDDGAGFYGWAVAEAFAREKPTLKSLLARYDQTSKEDRAERRKWAERAVALDPFSGDAEQRLIEILTELGDRAALDSAVATFARYRAHQPALPTGSNPSIFIYDGTYIEPVAQLSDGVLEPLGRVSDTHEDIYSRGQFFYVYSGNHRVGTIATAMQFNCSIRPCPGRILTRSVEPSVGQAQIATDFLLPGKDRAAPVITARQKSILAEMMKTQIHAGYSGRTASLLLEQMAKNTAWARTGYTSLEGRLLLWGQLGVGSMNDAHYGDQDSVYASLLVIAEQQADGTFKLAHSPAHTALENSGCAAISSIDLDGDGTDEMLLECHQLEGSYDFRLLKRGASGWKDVEPRTPVKVKLLSATIQDEKVSGAAITLERGAEQTAVGVTDAQGQVNLKASAGDDPATTLVARKSGYADLVVKCPCNGRTYPLSPSMDPHSLRIVLSWGGDAGDVLSWGANSMDLDAHLVYPNNHIFFKNKTGADALLEVDDAAARTKTITISRKHPGERYVYAVQNYSARNDYNSDRLMNSGAKVFVYLGRSLVKTYDVPEGRGNLWEVFALTESGGFQDINLMLGDELSADDVANFVLLKH